MLNILLVDDEPDLRVSLGDVLREEGHAVDVASDGEVAIAAPRGAELLSPRRQAHVAAA